MNDTLYFPADRALAAMGNTSRRWQNHLDMGKIFVPPDIDPVNSQGPGRGKLRRLSLEAIVQGAIAFALTDCGVDVREAYRVGAQFVYLGEIRGPFGHDETAPLDPVLDRMAGKLFPDGETYLIFTVGDMALHENRISIISDKNPAFDTSRGVSAPSAVIYAADGESTAPRIILNLSHLCLQIASSLGINFTAAFLTEVQ